MKFLLTGGAGFIGSHLAELLLARGDRVRIIDDFSTGGIENIQHLKEHKGFKYVLDTVMNRSVMAELVDEADVILHLAAAAEVRSFVFLSVPSRLMARVRPWGNLSPRPILQIHKMPTPCRSGRRSRR